MEKLLKTIEEILQPKTLDSIEQFVLSQSWAGKTYEEMAKCSGYASNYIKEIGSQLWQDISDALGERVTKKNLHLILNKYQHLSNHQQEQPFPQNSKENLNTQKQVIDVFPTTKIDFPGGPVPLNSPFYINRPPLEELVYSEIMQPGCLIRIRAPQKMGKSSLLYRMMDYAKKQDYQTVYLNFQEADEDVFASLDRFLRWFCVNVSRQLNLCPSLDDFWDADIGSKVSCKIYFEGYILQYTDNHPIVLALNEVNRLFEYPHIAQDFLPMLRCWHEQSKQEYTWQKLRLVVVHSTEVYVPLHINQSPFNVGLAVFIPRFTTEQVQKLANCYGLHGTSHEAETQDIKALQAIVGGHPYLINLAFYYLRQGQSSLDVLLQQAITPAGIYSQHLRELLTIIQAEPKLMSAIQEVLVADEEVQIDALTAYKLESMGLIELDNNQTRVSCELYRLYFREQLDRQNRFDSFSKL